MSNKFSRRRFLQLSALTAAAGAFPSILRAASLKPHVVVVGGGFAGATVAKYLRHWTSDVEVTLIDENAIYQSCILSNLVLNGSMTLQQIQFSYDSLASRHGVNIVNQRVEGIDAQAQTVSLSDGQRIPYDRLVLAPGVAFDAVDGLDSNLVPHAWKAGPQTDLLRNQLLAMPSGGRFVMHIPAAPYRCPPGPYERACLVADWLRSNKPGSTVTVLDANPDITAEPDNFHQAFSVEFAGIVDYVPNAQLLSVDSAGRTAHTSLGDFQADVLNVIPPQRAGLLVGDSGLANVNGRWAGVNPLSYESTAIPNIHIIGDAQGTGQPKAGHIANAEAKVCADAILRLLAGGQPYASPKTNSACYSPITASTATWLTAVYAYDAGSGSMRVVPGASGASPGWSNSHYRRMFNWANSLFGDTFG